MQFCIFAELLSDDLGRFNVCACILFVCKYTLFLSKLDGEVNAVAVEVFSR